MKAELLISILSLISTIIIGLLQIKLSKKQKSIASQINKIETKIYQSGSNNKMNGIIGNSNNGDICNNRL